MPYITGMDATQIAGIMLVLVVAIPFAQMLRRVK